MRLDGLKQTFLHATDSLRAAGDNRVALRGADRRTAQYDGAWWPRSRDLADELARLLAAVDVAGRGVTRVSFATRAWDPAPRKIDFHDRVVRLTGFTWMDDRLVTLSGSAGRDRLSLMVIPSATDPVVAKRTLRKAGEPLDALLPHQTVPADEAVGRWENEGGRTRV